MAGRRGVWRNLSLKAISLGLERGCRLAVTVLAAPILGEAAFGRFVFASTVTAFLVLAADLGLGTWSTRALARGRPEGDVVVRVGLGLRTALAVPYGVAVLVVAWCVDAGTRVPVLLLGVAALLNATSASVPPKPSPITSARSFATPSASPSRLVSARRARS